MTTILAKSPIVTVSEDFAFQAFQVKLARLVLVIKATALLAHKVK